MDMGTSLCYYICFDTFLAKSLYHIQILFSAIFGKDKYLRPGKDDDRLLKLLNADDSEFEGGSDSSDNEDINVETVVEEDLEKDISEQELENMAEDGNEEENYDDSDPEWDIPLSTLRENMAAKPGRMNWKKSDR